MRRLSKGMVEMFVHVFPIDHSLSDISRDQSSSTLSYTLMIDLTKSCDEPPTIIAGCCRTVSGRMREFGVNSGTPSSVR